jgi:hypothetical protein
MGSSIKVRVDEGKASDSKIDLQDFQAAQRDPKVKAFLAEASEYGKKLKKENRVHH